MNKRQAKKKLTQKPEKKTIRFYKRVARMRKELKKIKKGVQHACSKT